MPYAVYLGEAILEEMSVKFCVFKTQHLWFLLIKAGWAGFCPFQKLDCWYFPNRGLGLLQPSGAGGWAHSPAFLCSILAHKAVHSLSVSVPADKMTNQIWSFSLQYRRCRKSYYIPVYLLNRGSFPTVPPDACSRCNPKNTQDKWRGMK